MGIAPDSDLRVDTKDIIMKRLICLACLLVAAVVAAEDPSDPKEEIRLLAEAAGMTRRDVKALIKNPPESPNDVEAAILELAAAIMANDDNKPAGAKKPKLKS